VLERVTGAEVRGRRARALVVRASCRVRSLRAAAESHADPPAPGEHSLFGTCASACRTGAPRAGASIDVPGASTVEGARGGACRDDVLHPARGLSGSRVDLRSAYRVAVRASIWVRVPILGSRIELQFAHRAAVRVPILGSRIELQFAHRAAVDVAICSRVSSCGSRIDLRLAQRSSARVFPWSAARALIFLVEVA
jgi:hypothetical protein